jgi:hypothetical protein
MLHQKPKDSAGAGRVVTPSPEAGVIQRRATERGRRKIGPPMPHNYLPPRRETVSPAETPLADESGRQDLLFEPLLTETTVAPPLCPNWLDPSPVVSKRRAFSAEEKCFVVRRLRVAAHETDREVDVHDKGTSNHRRIQPYRGSFEAPSPDCEGKNDRRLITDQTKNQTTPRHCLSGQIQATTVLYSRQAPGRQLHDQQKHPIAREKAMSINHRAI